MNIQEKIKLFEQWKKESYYPFIENDVTRYRHSELEDIFDFFSNEVNTDKIPLFLGSTIPRIRKMVTAWVDEQNIHKKVVEQKYVDYFEVLNLEGDFKWVQLIGKNSFDNEGLLMDHCVASYFNHNNGNIILSLRTELNDPKITVEYNPNRNMIIQVRARRNNLISKKYAKYLMELFNYLKSPMNNWIDSDCDRKFGLRERVFDYSLYIKENAFFSKIKLNIDDELSNTQCFDVLNEKTNLVCDIVHFKRRFGLLNSIICDILICDYNDIDLLTKIKIDAAKSIKINDCPDDVIIDQPENWICNKLITDNLKRITLRRTRFGELYDMGTFPNIDYVGFPRNEMNVILSGTNVGKSSSGFIIGAMGSGKSSMMRELIIRNCMFKESSNQDPLINFVSKKLMDINKNYDSVTMAVNPSSIIKAIESAHASNYAKVLNQVELTINEMPSITIKDNSNERFLKKRIIVDKKKTFTGKL
jgi:hypothetical protein